MCVFVCVFPEGVLRVQRVWGGGGGDQKGGEREREGVVCQTLQHEGVQSKEMSCASALPGTA